MLLNQGWYGPVESIQVSVGDSRWHPTLSQPHLATRQDELLLQTQNSEREGYISQIIQTHFLLTLAWDPTLHLQPFKMWTKLKDGSGCKIATVTAADNPSRREGTFLTLAFDWDQPHLATLQDELVLQTQREGTFSYFSDSPNTPFDPSLTAIVVRISYPNHLGT